MPRKLEAYIEEILSAIEAIKGFVVEISFASYVKDEKTKSAVERKLLVIGEALNQMKKIEPKVEEQITDFKKIVAFRNILVHGYFGIDDQIVWNTITTKLDPLKSETESFKTL